MLILQDACKKGAQGKIDLYFEKLEALLVSNRGGDGYFVGDSVSLLIICIDYGD